MAEASVWGAEVAAVAGASVGSVVEVTLLLWATQFGGSRPVSSCHPAPHGGPSLVFQSPSSRVLLLVGRTVCSELPVLWPSSLGRIGGRYMLWMSRWDAGLLLVGLPVPLRNRRMPHQ